MSANMAADAVPGAVSTEHTQADAKDILLSVDNVTLTFGGVKAISDISFNIHKGEIRAIIGPNGAGKTSMLNVINGFYHPQQGRISYKGKTRKRMKPYQAASSGIARTFQNVALFSGMSTLDNIMSGRSLKMKRGLFWQMLHVGPAREEEIEHRAHVEQIIDFLEIAHIRKQPVGKLPYGLQKRVELGRAMAMEPELLLLDEPMAGMNLERLSNTIWVLLWTWRIAWLCWTTGKRLLTARQPRCKAIKMSSMHTWGWRTNGKALRRSGHFFSCTVQRHGVVARFPLAGNLGRFCIRRFIRAHRTGFCPHLQSVSGV